MKKIFEKAWIPKEYEQKLYSNWDESGYFKPEINMPENPKYDRALEGKPFVIPIPPPNVTGRLHIGHSLFVTLEDIMTRFHRMLGEPTLWIPGTDHAGIATQSVVDRELKKKGINRHEIGREKFIEEVWKWKEEYGGIITEQLKRMGASCDWSRERFTLDEGLSEAVKEAFVHLYNKGLIYRGEYIVNWCPKCGTAIADDEMNREEQEAKLYYFRYDKDFPITIATTRPETKLGDTAVAVNPLDVRYAKYIGKEFDIELDGVQRKIKVIADRSIDMKFGSGAVGITPAHSVVDWKIGEANNLPVIKVIDERAKMTAEAGKYEGMKVLEARERLLEYLKSEKLLEKEEKITNNLSICYRCGGAIEPIPSLQWFVKMRPLAEKAKAAVEGGDIKILPRRFEKVYYQWMDNIRDWCISRQLWWGHRIPVWYKQEMSKSLTDRQAGELLISNEAPNPNVKNDEIYVGIEPPEGEGWVQDEDVLDTWFSSALWPFSSLGWPLNKTLGFDENLVDLIKSGEKTKTFRLKDKNLSEGEWYKVRNSQMEKDFGFAKVIGTKKTTIGDLQFNQEGHEKYKDKADFIATMQKYYPDTDIRDDTPVWIYEFKYTQSSDLNYFYPTTVLETGYDILFFWVARMVMMGLELTDKPPFETVYLHGLVRDEHNRKMSKSLGNALDPLDMIDKYGTDAVRMGLVVGTTPGQDVPVGENKIKGYRNFSNKIWNASRFVSLRVSDGDLSSGELGDSTIENLAIDSDISTDADKKILEAHEEIKEKVTVDLKEFKFSGAGEALYEYFWHNFCDIYIEAAKGQLRTEEHNNLSLSLGASLRTEKQKGSHSDPSVDGEESRDPSTPFQDDTAVSDNTKKILIKVLTESLQMLHPFVPYVTEAVWQELREIYPALADSIMISRWPA